MNRIVKARVLFGELRTMKDRGNKMTIFTQELPAEESATLIGLSHNFGWALFAANEVKESDIEDIELPQGPTLEFKGEKSHSQRLRDVLYRYWEQSPQNRDMEFKAFYKIKMEQLIGFYKEKLS